MSDILVSDFGLLQQIGGALLNSLLLRGMVDNIISDFLSLGVERHDGLLKDVHLLFDVGFFDVHSAGFILGLSDGVLEHHELLVESLSFILNFELSLFQKIFVILHFLELGVKFFRVFLFFLGFISDSGNFRFNLKNIILLLFDEFFNGLQSLISLLHTEERFLPVIKKSLLRHDDLFNLDGSLLQGIPGSGSFLFLRNQLCLIKSLLLIKTLDLFVHGVDQSILAFLLLFKIDDRLFSSVGCPSCNGDLRFHYLIVLLNLLEGTVELIELLLGLEHSLELVIGLFLLTFVLLLKDFVLLLSLNSVPLNNVVVIVSPLKLGLHLGKLMLHTI